MGDDQFAAEKERLEEKHRLEVLNLLRSFEFERKDFESRLQAKLQEKEHDRSYDTDTFLHELEDVDEKLEGADDDVRRRFEQIKEEFLKRIKQLENEVLKRGKEESDKEKGISEKGSCFLACFLYYDWFLHLLLCIVVWFI